MTGRRRDGAQSREYPDRPLVGIAAVVFRGDEVLLIRRARPPLAGGWSFPGGAQRLGETAEDAARRELAEETGGEAGPLAIASHADVIDRDEAGLIRFHYTILHFAGAWAGGAPVAASDAAEARFVRLRDLEETGLDAVHRAVVARARAVLGTS